MADKRIKPAPASGPVINRCGCRNLGPLGADEGPSREDLDRFGGVTRQCPECGTELFDQARACWQCGHRLEAPRRPKMWTAAAAVVVLIAFILWVVL